MIRLKDKDLIVHVRYRMIQEKMITHCESRLVIVVKRAEYAYIGDMWRMSRCWYDDLDFSILEIEMMRHNQSPRDRLAHDSANGTGGKEHRLRATREW